MTVGFRAGDVGSARRRRNYHLRFNVPYAGHVETKVLTFLYRTREYDGWFPTREIARQLRDSYQDVYGALERLFKRRFVLKEKGDRQSLWRLDRGRISLIEEDLADHGLEEAIVARDERKKNEAERTLRRCELHISGAKGLEAAEEVLSEIDDLGDVKMVVQTYRWSHDGPFGKQDYEPIIYFYERNEDLPKHAISFSHYGHVYHKNLIPWEDEDYSPRFPNSFHTPVLKAERTEIRNGILSHGAYAAARMGLIRKQLDAAPDSSKRTKGLPPSSIEISDKVRQVVSNGMECWDEFERQ